MKPTKNISGHLTVTKQYLDKRPDEVVVDQENIITIGLSKFLADIMCGTLGDDIPLSAFGLHWLQLGASAQDSYTTNYFYELSAPFTVDDFGVHTSMQPEQIPQQVAVNPFYEPPTFTTTTGTFIDLDYNHISKITDDKVIFTILLDENTLNGKAITEAGLFYNFAPEGNKKLHLGAYKAFGITDGLGTASPITKTKDFILQLEWVLSTNTGKVIELEVTESGENYNFYKSPHTNPEGNALVCYFPHIAPNQEPYTKYTNILDRKQDNIEVPLFQRFLSNGISVASFNYRFPTSTTPSASPVFTTSRGTTAGLVADASTALLPDSTQPLTLPGGLENCYTDAVSSIQWAKDHGASSWGISPSSVFSVGNGIGGTLAAFVAYGPDCSSSQGQYFEVCSSRVLATSLKESVTDWYRWYPYTLSTFDFNLALEPRQIRMYASKQHEQAGVVDLETSSTDYYDTDMYTTPHLTSALSGTVSSYIFDEADLALTDASGFYWSAIPTLKELFQWRETPDIPKRYWSPAHQASATSSVLDSRWSSAYWGHPDNSQVFAHLSYAGASTSGTNIVDMSGTHPFKLLDYSANDYIEMGDTPEPVINLDASTPIGYVSSIDASLGTSPQQEYFRTTSALANDMRDEMQGKQLLETLQSFGGDQLVSSIFVNYDSTAEITPGSHYRKGNTSVFKNWNLNMEAACARDRANFILNIIRGHDSWYNQFD